MKNMKKKNKLEISRFILSIATPSIMLLHLMFISLMVSFLEILLFVGVFYIPIILLYFISTIIPFIKISGFKRPIKLIVAIAIVVVTAGSLTLLFLSAAGSLGANAISHGARVIRVTAGNFQNFIIVSFSTIAILVLFLMMLSVATVLAKSNLTQGEQKNEPKN